MPVSVAYALQIDGENADSDLMDRIQQIEVEEHVALADMLRLTLSTGVKEDGSGWSVLDEGLFERLTPIKLQVILGTSLAVVLFDGFVVEISASFAEQPGESTLEIMAMDASVRMNLTEKIQAWPNMADDAIATSLFSQYGFVPITESTKPNRSEDDVLTMQRETDIQFLHRLARRSGYNCYVEPNPVTGVVEGHFHPPQLAGATQSTLSVDMGDRTNVADFRLNFDMMRPTTARFTHVDVESRDDQEADVEAISWPLLGQTSVLADDNPRQRLLSGVGLARSGEMRTYAQAEVNRSGWAISAQGTLHTGIYEGLLRAKRPVTVRGIGPQHSGIYFVTKVLHHITGDGYTQAFTLHRNALGLTGSEEFEA